ncbi:MAG: hypothetical protein GTN88_11960 [Gammaproteobacteria bacterium]|nr:hypothetical protein [Gammaproteobacteria bacterium]NIQ27182.1 hypothetical protein [Gammaproteobacteria bacterium]
MREQREHEQQHERAQAAVEQNLEQQIRGQACVPVVVSSSEAAHAAARLEKNYKLIQKYSRIC